MGAYGGDECGFRGDIDGFGGSVRGFGERRLELGIGRASGSTGSP